MYLLLIALAGPVDDNWLPASSAQMDAFTKRGECPKRVGTDKKGNQFAVAYGIVDGQVVYVVFVHGPPKEQTFEVPIGAGRTPQIEPDGTTNQHAHANLSLPEGKTVRLPLRRQLLEVANGKVRFSDRRVTLAELKAYFDAKNKEYTLDDLLQFVEARRARKK